MPRPTATTRDERFSLCGPPSRLIRTVACTNPPFPFGLGDCVFFSLLHAGKGPVTARAPPLALGPHYDGGLDKVFFERGKGKRAKDLRKLVPPPFFFFSFFRAEERG